MDITAIKAGISYGADIPGSEKAPDALEQKGLFSTIASLGHKIEIVSVNQAELPEEQRYKDSQRVKWAGEILDVTNRVYEAVDDAYENGRFPFIIGGDQSAALGSLKATCNRYSDVAVVWIGAHANLNSYQTSPSANYHGMVLATMIGQSDSRFEDKLQRFLNPRNLILVGTRSVDEDEQKILLDQKVNEIPCRKVIGCGATGRGTSAVESIMSIIRRRKAKRIHLSIDVGVMDPAFAPAVNVPAEGGVSPEDLYGLVRCLASTGMLCCVDLLEYNPLRDEDGLTAASIESVMYGLWG